MAEYSVKVQVAAITFIKSLPPIYVELPWIVSILNVNMQVICIHRSSNAHKVRTEIMSISLSLSLRVSVSILFSLLLLQMG